MAQEISGDSEREIYADTEANIQALPAASPVPELFRVGVRVPPFWTDKPAIWFAQLEGQFIISRITDDATKFYYIVGHLDNQTSAEVEDIITSPPADGKYETLKSELIKRLSVSRENKVKRLLMHEELGDRKPSQFLRHLQHLAGPTIPDDFLKTIWTSRLPNAMQTIIASQSTQSMQSLAELADRIQDIAPSTPQVAMASTSKPDSVLDLMSRHITELTKQVSALTAQVNNPSRSRSRSRRSSNNRGRSPSTRSQSCYKKHPLCWYHYRHAENAKRCIQPCDFKSGNGQGSL